MSETRDVFGLKNIQPKPAEPATVAQMVLIERLRLDGLENSYYAAVRYEPFVIAKTPEQAQAMVDAAGFQDGSGWPIHRGDRLPVLRYRALPLVPAPAVTQTFEVSGTTDRRTLDQIAANMQRALYRNL